MNGEDKRVAQARIRRWMTRFFSCSMLDGKYCRSRLKPKLWDFGDANYIAIKVMVAMLCKLAVT